MNLSVLSRYVLLICFVILLVNISRSINDMNRAKNRLTEAENEVKILEEQKQKIIKNSALRNSSNYLELLIRDKLKMVKENETLIVLPSELEENSIDESFRYSLRDDAILSSKKNWQKWIETFFN